MQNKYLIPLLIRISFDSPYNCILNQCYVYKTLCNLKRKHHITSNYKTTNIYVASKHQKNYTSKILSYTFP